MKPHRLSAEALRHEFDDAFARRPVEPSRPENLLAMRIHGDLHAMRVSEIAGLFGDRPITPMPSRRVDLIGLAAFRRAILPVFDLATVLGYTPAVTPRWIVIAAVAPIAFAFETFEGHHQLARDAAAGAVVALDGRSCPLISIATLVERVRGTPATAQETRS